jgi:hypothetical protein
MAFTNILFEEKNAIAFVAVNRSKVPNALNMTTMEELRAAFLVFLAFGLISCPNSLHAQATAVYAHDHMPTRCVDVPAGEKRPEFGCFKVGTARGLQFSESKIFGSCGHSLTAPRRNRPKVQTAWSWKKTGASGFPSSDRKASRFAVENASR